jgi:hypothetical protein
MDWAGFDGLLRGLLGMGGKLVLSMLQRSVSGDLGFIFLDYPANNFGIRPTTDR